jgi:hypothetical protein
VDIKTPTPAALTLGISSVVARKRWEKHMEKHGNNGRI